MDRLRLSYLSNAARMHPRNLWSDADVGFVAADLQVDREWVRHHMAERGDL